MSEYIIEFSKVTKTFLDGKIVANDQVSFGIKKGTIHAIAGENGAGKSTLLSMLFGLYKPNSGQIFVKGKEVNYKTAADAMRDGLGMVQQHFQLVEKYTVGQNVTLGKEKTFLGFVKTKKDFKRINEISQNYGFGVRAEQKISNLTVGQEQKTEILKLLFSEAEILIFDEPTAMLTPSEIDELLDVMLKLKSEGKTIILITHKLDEIKKVADEVTVLRKGKYVGLMDRNEISAQKLSRMMIGSDLVEVTKKYSKGEEAALEIKNLVVMGKGSSWFMKEFSKKMNQFQRSKNLHINILLKPYQNILAFYLTILEYCKLTFSGIVVEFKKNLKNLQGQNTEPKKFFSEAYINAKACILAVRDYFGRVDTDFAVEAAKLKSVSLTLKSNEILSISGIEGNGQTELVDALLGLQKERSGTIIAHNNGKAIDISKLSIKKRNKLFSSIPEDRHKYGMILDMKLSENLVIKNFDEDYAKFGFIQKKKIAKDARALVKKFDVRGADGGNAIARGLSGGNQQKAVVGREITLNRPIMIIFQATRGLDVGAINYIHEQIIQSRDAGKAVLLVSYDLNEVIKLSDRVLVMNSGKITGELKNKEITRDEIGILMSAKGGE